MLSLRAVMGKLEISCSLFRSKKKCFLSFYTKVKDLTGLFKGDILLLTTVVFETNMI